MKRHGNAFQLSTEALRRLLREQIGVKGTAPTLALNGYWDAPATFEFTISEIPDSGGIVAMCDDGLPLDCTASFLMRHDVCVKWRPASRAFRYDFARSLDEPCHRAAMARAESLALAYLDTAPRARRDRATIVTLDGGGNRTAFRAVFREAGAPAPRVVTLERDAEVALAQRILFGDVDVVYTGGDASLRTRGRTTGLEDLVVRGRLSMADDVDVLYLDYCGGPPAKVDLRVVLSKFPNLQVYAATVSRRQHAGIEESFSDYVPILDGFVESATFTQNRLVVCKTFVRRRPAALVRVPGCFWHNCPSKLRRKRFRGVVVEEHENGDATAVVGTERGDEIVRLSKRAKAAYSARR